MTIVQIGHPTLRETARPIQESEFSSPEFKDVVARMKKDLEEQKDGVAIAAPQIGEPLRIFVLSPHIFESPEGEPLVYSNPEIIKSSSKKKWMNGEGCLSVRGVYGQTHRHTNVTVRAYNEDGKQFTRGAGGLLAHIFQHEIDHLNGILFCDHARNQYTLSEQEMKEQFGDL